jgi:hypothetical protein
MFSLGFILVLTWIYNLRISYPTEEIRLGDNGAQGAFRHTKYNPNVIALHAAMLFSYLVFQCGATFGDNTSPSNWEVFARARQQLAQYLWSANTVLDQAKKYLPPLQLTPPPTSAEIASFCPAQRDTLNDGVFALDGTRRPPPFNHWVDDCLYADVGKFVFRMVAASVLALYILLGFPRPEVPNAVSQDKLVTLYGPVRKFVGYTVNTRSLEVQLLPRKRVKIINLLREWITRRTFLLLDAAHLLGLLEDAARYNKWGRAWFFLLHNALRDALQKRAYFIARQFNRDGRKAHFRKILPGHLHKRVLSLVSLAHAKLLWGSKTHTAVSQTVKGCVTDLLSSFQDFDWSAKIPFIIPRVPNVSTTGDASEIGGGGFSTIMRFWFDVWWSDEVKYRLVLASSDPGHIQINCLEFLVVILQLAATIVFFQ